MNEKQAVSGSDGPWGADRPSLFAACAKAPSAADPKGEAAATEYMGSKLTPIGQQRNNALKGTQNIDRATYKLTVDGLVDIP